MIEKKKTTQQLNHQMVIRERRFRFAMWHVVFLIYVPVTTNTKPFVFMLAISAFDLVLHQATEKKIRALELGKFQSSFQNQNHDFAIKGTRGC